MFQKYHHIHFVGIGGIGMSGIAEVLLTLGYLVSGSDLKSTDTTRKLKSHGAKIFKGHDRKYIAGAHAVVVSSAVNTSNPEVQAALEAGVPVVPRAEMLAELMRLKWGVAVAGSHGKTSTTAMIASIFHSAGLDPTMVIGGKVNSLRTNARLGKGEYLIAEADESDRSFLKLTPTIAVITNIDPEHMEQYQDFEHLQQAFIDFANKVPFYGAVVACSDHPIVQKIIPRFEKRVISYGSKNADYMASELEQVADKLSFTVLHQGKKLGRLQLNLVGKHYALNALAAVAVASECGIPFTEIQRALRRFTGVARRFQILRKTEPMIVDDYGHHPAEVAATLAAARLGWPDRRLVAVVQPHRYSRLKFCFEDFVQSFADADSVLVMDVYAAGETANGYTGEKLCKTLSEQYPSKTVNYVPKEKDLLKVLKPETQTTDMVVFLGAGDITTMAKNFSKMWTSTN